MDEGESTLPGLCRAMEDTAQPVAEPQSCPYFKELDHILGAGHSLPHPLVIDSGLEMPVIVLMVCGRVCVETSRSRIWRSPASAHS